MSIRTLPTFVVALMIAGMSRAAPETAPVYLTHFSVTLDADTYATFKASPVIAELAASEERHTVAGNDSWTGFYLYGRQTYMEMFSDAELPEGTKPGDCSIGLSVEAVGALAPMITRLKEAFGKDVESDLKVRTVGDRNIPWFEYVSIHVEPPASNDIWLEEADPDYMRTVYPDVHTVNGLSRQEQMSNAYMADRLLDNVTEIDSEVTWDQLDRFRKELPAAGWKLHPGKDGFTARGPDMVFKFAMASGRTGIRTVHLALARPHRSETVHVGHVVLDFSGGPAATLQFF